MAVTADQVIVEVTAVIGPYTQAMVQVATVTTRNMAAAEDAAKKGSEGIAKGLEAVASRIPGLVKGFEDGEDAVRLFMQEGSKLLATFGPWGAALGAVVGAIEAVAASMGAFGIVAITAKEAAESFNAAVEATKGVVPEADATLRGYKDTLSLVERGYLQLAQLKLEQAISDNNALIEDQSTKLAEAAQRLQAEFLTAVTKRVDPMAGMAPALTETEEQYAAFLRRIKTLRPTDLEGLTDITLEVRKMAPVFEAAGLSVQPLLDQIGKLVGPLDEASRQHSMLAEVQDRMKGTSELLAGAVRLVNGIFGEGTIVYDAATGSLKLAAQAMDDAKGAAERAAPAVAGLISKFELLDLDPRPKPVAGLSFGRRSGTADLQTILAGVLGQDWSGTVPPGSAPPGFGIPSRPGGGRRGAATPDGDADRIKRLEEARRLYEQTLTPLEAYFQAQDRILSLHGALSEALGSESAAQEVMNRALKQAADTYVAAQDKIDQTTEKAEEATKRQKELSDAIVAVGDVFKEGIKGAKDFNDALDKIGLSLLDLAVKGLFGQGSLGGVFNQILGNPSGGAGIFGPGTEDSSGGGGSIIGGLLGKIGSWLFGGGLAGGGQALPGRLYEVGEAGREWFAPSVPGQVIPNHVIKAAAGGGAGSDQPITFNISMAGANGDRTIAEIAAAAVKRGLATVPEINRQHRIRFA